MKFEASRAESFFQELGDPRYAGPEGEARVADFVAGQFAKMGLDVERREVVGSRFPQRVGPWVAWLGYGLLVTATHGLLLQDNPLFLIAGIALFFGTLRWVNGVMSNAIRPGRGGAPIETAPVLIATLPGPRSAPIRVVLQSVIAGVKADPFQVAFRGPIKKWAAWALLLLVPFFLAWTILIFRLGVYLNPHRPGLLRGFVFLTLYVHPTLLVMVWVGIVTCLSIEYRRSSRMAGQDPPDRRGLAILLEMARTWPRTGSRPIEPAFIAAGGHPLDYAGSREVVRLLKSRRSSDPALLVLFFAPGAGGELWLGAHASRESRLEELSEGAARSLWIPFRRDDPFTLLSLWPFEDFTPAIALIGSATGALDDGPVDPQVLHRAAQLATEIALRWAKQQASALGESAG